MDHKAEAERLLATGHTDAAHAHAALYAGEQTAALVGQQRITNLLAYWQLHTPRTVSDSLEADHIEVHLLDLGDGNDVDQVVREGLGIS